MTLTALVVLTAALALALLGAERASAAPMTQLSGAAACIANAGAPLAGNPCATGNGLKGVGAVAVSPDGRHAYAVAYGSNAVTAFSRDPATGALTQLPGSAGCISNADSPAVNGCQPTGSGLQGAAAVTVSPDGKHVYVAGMLFETGDNLGGSIVTFSRNAATGALTQLDQSENGCWGYKVNGALPGCAIPEIPNFPGEAMPLAIPTDVEISPDGGTVYVTSLLESGVSVFSRNASTGSLSPQSCVQSTLALAPQNGCPKLPGGTFYTDIALAPNGEMAYVAGLGFGQFQGQDLPGSVIVLKRSQAGDLSAPPAPGGCIADSTQPLPDCTVAVGVANPFRVAVSPDSNYVYAMSSNAFPATGIPGPGPGAISVFSTDTVPLAQLPNGGCLQELGLPAEGFFPRPGCSTTVAGLLLPTQIAFSADGTSAVSSNGFHSAVTYTRNPANGNLTQDPLNRGCTVNNAPSTPAPLLFACQHGVALNAPASLALSPDGQNAYIASGGWLTSVQAFAEILAPLGITGDDAIAVFGPSPPPTPPAPPPPTPEPPAPPPPASASVASTRVQVSSTGVARVTVACSGTPGQTCAGNLYLDLARRVSVRGVTRTYSIAGGTRLGNAPYMIAGGSSATLPVTLGQQGRRALSTNRTIPVLSRVQATGSAVLTDRQITLVASFAPPTRIISAATRVKNNRGRWRLRCTAPRNQRCTGRLTITIGSPPRTIGSTKFTINGGRTKTISVRLRNSALRRINRNGRLNALANATSTIPVGNATIRSRRVHINRATTR